MNDINWQHIKAGFAREFRPEEIGAAPGNKGGGAYVDARSIDERLDEVAGPENWSVSYRIIDLAAGVVEATITVHGISKSDAGYPNNTMGMLNKSGNLLEPEPMKAAYSDAIKRAAVHWGIGRYLYPYASKQQRAGSDHEEPPRTETPKTDATPVPNADMATQGQYLQIVEKVRQLKALSPNTNATVPNDADYKTWTSDRAKAFITKASDAIKRLAAAQA